MNTQTDYIPSKEELLELIEYDATLEEMLYRDEEEGND